MTAQAYRDQRCSRFPWCRSDPRATISWDVVDIVSLEADEPFQQVRLADKTTGFVPTDKLRSLLDYRLVASSRNGRWSITSLIAGD